MKDLTELLAYIWRRCHRCNTRTRHSSTVVTMADGRKVETIRCTECGEVNVYEV